MCTRKGWAASVALPSSLTAALAIGPYKLPCRITAGGTTAVSPHSTAVPVKPDEQSAADIGPYGSRRSAMALLKNRSSMCAATGKMNCPVV